MAKTVAPREVWPYVIDSQRKTFMAFQGYTNFPEIVPRTSCYCEMCDFLTWVFSFKQKKTNTSDEFTQAGEVCIINMDISQVTWDQIPVDLDWRITNCVYKSEISSSPSFHHASNWMSMRIAHLNPHIQGKTGFLQKAVTWLRGNIPELMSRRQIQKLKDFNEDCNNL